MVRRLAAVVPDLGKEVSGDASHLCSRRTRGKGKRVTGNLPQAGGGRKEYSDEDGKVVHVLEWFGYKLHLLVDRKHEVALAYNVSAPQTGDSERVSALVEQAKRTLPKRRIRTLAYDKAADAQEVHAYLHQEGIKPLIQMRSLWKEELERLLPGSTGQDNVVYDEAGTLYCYDKTSQPPVRRKMAYIGHEKQRGTLKYRCPARHEGWRCPHDGVCNRDKEYGKTVRVKQEIDLRRFPPIPRATRAFEQQYKGRTASERVNARLKIFWGLDDGNTTGAERFHAQVALVMIVHAGLAALLASAPRYEGTLGQTRLSPIAKALQQKWKT
jgi:hypothetical protein